MITYQEMVDLFERANAAFLKHDKALFANQVSSTAIFARGMRALLAADAAAKKIASTCS